jgi:AP-1 complex subunit beta-1
VRTQDVEDANPLLRALAIRTMGCIRVDKILDYLSLPLGKGLKVRRTYSSLSLCAWVRRACRG